MSQTPRAIVVKDKESGATLGFVVIDSTINGRARGGLRMMPDVSQDEIAKLARAMTLKYGLLGLPQGGAKAGVLGNPEGGAGERKRALHRFAMAILGTLVRGEYVPDSDMGTSATAIREMLEAIGVPVSRRDYRGGRSGLYTAGTVFQSALAAAAMQGMDPVNCTVAIEGFGAVGQPLADMFVRSGSRVVAISTTFGGLYDPGGLDIGRLQEMASRMGGASVEEYDARKRIDKSRLKEIPADIFCPCARHDSVREEDAAGMPARVLSCGANSPVTPPAERLLWQRGIVCVPDFVANCGGVLGGTMEFCGWRPQEILPFFEQRFRSAAGRFIASAMETGKPLRETAEEAALRRFGDVKRKTEQQSVFGRCFSSGIALYRQGWVPPRLMRLLSRGYFDQRVP